jgi:hypothetical protein
MRFRGKKEDGGPSRESRRPVHRASIHHFAQKGRERLNSRLILSVTFVLIRATVGALRTNTSALDASCLSCRMPRLRIYVETTVPSAYYTSRSAPEMVEQRDQTRRWWRAAMHACELVSSVITLGELEEGRSEHVPARIAMIRSLDLLDVTPDVTQTARTYSVIASPRRLLGEEDGRA